jgi:nitrilase
VTPSLVDDEGIVYADIDLARCIQPKQMHDIIGHYNRFDVLQLHLDATPRSPLITSGRGPDVEFPVYPSEAAEPDSRGRL